MDAQNNPANFRKWIINYDIGKGGVLLLLLAVVLLPLFMLSFYNHPCADDYFDATLAIQKGIFGAQKWWYMNWGGRYFSTLLLCINPLVFHVYWAYKLNVLLLVPLLVIGAYWLSGKVFPNLNKTAKIGMSSLFIFAFVRHLPEVSSGIFWQCGAYNCLTADIMTFFLLGCIIGYYHSVHKKWYLILSCVLAIAIVGCYEISLLSVDLIVLLIAFANAIKKRTLVFPITLLSVCIIFSFVCILAPGNSVRELTYPNAHKLLFSIHSALNCSMGILRQWLPFMLFIGLLLFDLLSPYITWNEETDFKFFISPWLTLIACFGITVISFFTHFWAEGQYPPLRLLNLTYFYFVLGMLYFSLSLIYRIKKRHPAFRLPVYVKYPLYIILVLLVFFRTNNITVAYNDILSGTASAYNKEMTERHDYLTNSKKDTCIIDSIRHIPQSLYFWELSDTTDWATTSFREYYNKKYIGLKSK